MARAYSYDLRQKVIQAIELDGWKKSEAAEIFQISRNTIDLWLKRRQETGDYRPLSSRPHFSKAKITDWQAFQEFAQRHGEKTQTQMALLWGEPISPRIISRGLKKIGLTRKSGQTPRRRQAQDKGLSRMYADQDKKTTDIKKEMRKKELSSKLN